MPDASDDTELEEQLRHIAERFDPVPARLLDAAVESYIWRTVDSDLAELVFDSLAEDVAPVRGPEHRRQLSFEASGLTISVEVTSSRADRRIIGQLAPPQRAAVEIRQGLDITSLDADELGRFSGPMRAGPFSLCFRVGTRRAVVTDWIAL